MRHRAVCFRWRFGARSSSKSWTGRLGGKPWPSAKRSFRTGTEDRSARHEVWSPDRTGDGKCRFRFIPHASWLILQVPGRTPCHGRYQYVLDFSRQEILDYIYEKIASILEGASISYIKWDMNRSLSDVWSRGVSARQQGEVFHRYILGVYQMYERLTTRFRTFCSNRAPAAERVLMQVCCITHHRDGSVMIQDAIERLRIQYGTSYGYPISSMGSHVSASSEPSASSSDTALDTCQYRVLRNFRLWTGSGTAREDELSGIKNSDRLYETAPVPDSVWYGFLQTFQSVWKQYHCPMAVSEDRTEAPVGWYRTLECRQWSVYAAVFTGLEESDLYNVTEYTEGHESAGKHPLWWRTDEFRTDYQWRLFRQYMDGRRESCDLWFSPVLCTKKQAE